MTEHFGYFDAVQDSNGNYDREYNAQQWTEPFRALVTTGVMKGAYNQLEVTANGANMVSAVKSGVAFVEGRYYYNDALVELIHDTEVIGLSRIDRIVVRMDTRTEARHVKIFIKKGVPSTYPVAPTLSQTQTVYEISLAQVKVVGGQTYIAVNALTDERGKDVICPWAGSKILPNFDNSALADLIQTVNSKANKQQEPWVNAVLQNGWNNNSGVDALRYYKDEFGIVRVEGVVYKDPANASIITTLPLGYRPQRNENISISNYMGSLKNGKINSNGTIDVSNVSELTLLVFNHSFRAI